MTSGGITVADLVFVPWVMSEETMVVDWVFVLQMCLEVIHNQYYQQIHHGQNTRMLQQTRNWSTDVLAN